MLSKLVRIVLWKFIHILYTILEYILVLWVYINLKIKEVRRLKWSKDVVKYISYNLRNISKKPQHVVLILDEDKLFYEDLARLIIWSLAAEISYFSLYDKTGVLNKNEDRLIEAVQKMKDKVPGHIKWASHPELNGYKNGTSNKITISLLSKVDSKERIVSVVRTLCDGARSGSLDPSLIDIHYIDRELCNNYPPFPEPNIAIYCGNKFCTNGLLPWHIRLTEFLNINSHHSIKLEKFVEVLQEYGQCEQRFGK